MESNIFESKEKYHHIISNSDFRKCLHSASFRAQIINELVLPFIDNDPLYKKSTEVRVADVLLYLYDYENFIRLPRHRIANIIEPKIEFMESIRLFLGYENKEISDKINIQLNSNYNVKQFTKIFKEYENLVCSCGEVYSIVGSSIGCNNPNCCSEHRIRKAKAMCKKCGIAFSEHDELLAHMNATHGILSQDIDVWCPYCLYKIVNITINQHKGSVVPKCDNRCFNIKRRTASEVIDKFKITRSKNTNTSNYSKASLLREKKFRETILPNGNTLKEEIVRKSIDKQSKTIKLKILNGEFTPNITNSWCNSRVLVGDKAFRSTWEAYFFIYNLSIDKLLEYETIRIPYIDPIKNITKTYILDFLDTENNVLYEIKPKSEKDNPTNIAKFKSASEYANGVLAEFIIIDDDWFKMHYDQSLLYKYITDEDSVNKCVRNLKQFKKDNRE